MQADTCRRKWLELKTFALSLLFVLSYVNAECEYSWQLYRNMASAGAEYYADRTSIESCRTTCIEEEACVAVDINFNSYPPECWLHLAEDLMLKRHFEDLVEQHVLTRYCVYNDSTEQKAPDIASTTTKTITNIITLANITNTTTTSSTPEMTTTTPSTTTTTTTTTTPSTTTTTTVLPTSVCVETITTENNTGSMGAMYYATYETEAICMDLCLTTNSCIAVDINTNAKPIECWIHRNLSIVLANKYYLPGIVQHLFFKCYQGVRRNGTQPTTSPGSTSRSVTPLPSTTALSPSTTEECKEAVYRYNSTGSVGAQYVSDIVTEQSCTDLCWRLSTCLAVDVNHNAEPVECWIHTRVEPLRRNYTLPGVVQFIMHRCPALATNATVPTTVSSTTFSSSTTATESTTNKSTTVTTSTESTSPSTGYMSRASTSSTNVTYLTTTTLPTTTTTTTLTSTTKSTITTTTPLRTPSIINSTTITTATTSRPTSTSTATTSPSSSSSSMRFTTPSLTTESTITDRTVGSSVIVIIVHEINPSDGIAAGGDQVSITGQFYDLHLLNNTKVYIGDMLQDNVQHINSSLITFEVKPYQLKDKQTTVPIYLQFGENRFDLKRNFTYRSNPEINNIYPREHIFTGGTKLTVTGENLVFVRSSQIVITVNVTDVSTTQTITGQFIKECTTVDVNIICMLPHINFTGLLTDNETTALFYDNSTTFNDPNMISRAKRSFRGIAETNVAVIRSTGSRKKRDAATYRTSTKTVEIYVGFRFDNYLYYINYTRVSNVTIRFVDLPTIRSNNIYQIDRYNIKNIIIPGQRLTKGARWEDYQVMIGQNSVCQVMSLYDNAIHCRPPDIEPEHLITGVCQEPAVPVSVLLADIQKYHVGCAKYSDLRNIGHLIIGLTAGIGGFLLLVITVLFLAVNRCVDTGKEDDETSVSDDPLVHNIVELEAEGVCTL